MHDVALPAPPEARGRGLLPRLSPLDLINLRVEAHGLPMNVAALLVLDRELNLTSVREVIGRRLQLSSRLRQRLLRPGFGLGPPVWVDVDAFDIWEHVKAYRVPAPGDEQALLRCCMELRQEPLPAEKPLWRIWLLTGISDGRDRLLVIVHHVLADGIAALAMFGALLDPEPGAAEPASRPFQPVPPPTRAALAADQARRVGFAVVTGVALLRQPGYAGSRLANLVRQALDLAREGKAPRLSLNVPATAQQQVKLIGTDLEQDRAIAHDRGGTINDLVLTAVAGGMRRLLQSRGELARGLTVKASVVASIRSPTDGRSGNQVGTYLVPLPVDDPDPGRRVATIARLTAERKRRPPYLPNARLPQRLTVAIMNRQHIINLLVSNLPGPTVRLRLCGAEVQDVFQIGALQGNVTVSVGAISYAGHLNLDVVADRFAVPDIAVFTDGIVETLAELADRTTKDPGR